MTNYITTYFNKRGEAQIDNSQLENLHFPETEKEISELVTNTIYFKSEDKELVRDLKRLIDKQS